MLVERFEWFEWFERVKVSDGLRQDRGGVTVFNYILLKPMPLKITSTGFRLFEQRCMDEGEVSASLWVSVCR